MRRKWALLSILVLAGAGGASAAACSSSTSSGGPEAPEAGADGTAGQDGDVGGDSGRDSGGGDAGPADGGRDAVVDGRAGNCSALRGPCDIVAQNCGGSEECVVTRAADGGLTTRCVAVTGTRTRPAGQGCCPNQANTCQAGLQCLGADCTADSGLSGRCSPPCCAGDDGVCGQSVEGFRGVCDIGISYPEPDWPADAGPAYMACTYSGVCKPLGLVPCPNGYACTIRDNLGSAKCVGLINPASPTRAGQPCSFGNECEDGTMCVGTPDGGAGQCFTLCLTPFAVTPFDAGLLDGGPGLGGCPTGRTCSGALSPQQFPAWLSICTAPDGGA